MNTTDIRELLDQRDKIDEQLKSLVNENGHTERKTIKCSVCAEEGHNSRSCPKK